MLKRNRILLYIGAPLVCFQLVVLFLCFRAARQRLVDFRGYYAAGQIVRSGQASGLYDFDTQRTAQWRLRSNIDVSTMRFVSAPFTALLFAPFSMLRFTSAYVLFLIFNLTCAGVALLLIRRLLPSLFANGPAIPVIFFFAFFPLGIALGQGQLSVVLLLLYCGATVAIARDRFFLAGVLVSLTLMKFQIALPVALLFLVWRRWRFLGGFALGAFILFLISLATVGITHPGQIHAFLIHTAVSFKSGPKPGLDPSAMTNIYGLACFFLKETWAVAATVLISVALVGWAARKPASLPLALMVALCVSVHLYVHDLTLLLLPLGLLIHRWMKRGHVFAGEGPHPTSKWLSSRNVAVFCSICLLLASPLQLWMMGRGWLPLLAIPLLVLTVALPSSMKGQHERPSPTRTLDGQCAIAAS